MNYDAICKALFSHYGHREWTLIGLDKVQLDGDHEPVEISSLGLQAQIDEITAEIELRQIKLKRASAYAAEADPLFFKAQRGEATIEEWQAKVAEIRSRYLYPINRT